MANYPIQDVEGIGPANAAKLEGAGIKNTDALLNASKTPADRKALAEKSGISDKQILKWANMADLMRVRGVGEEYSELLEAAGVDTVKELRNRKPGNLAEKMAEVNASRKLVRLVPSEKRVEAWVTHAKSLTPMMTY